MWTAVALWTLMLGGTAAYVGWAAWMAAHGTPLWLLIVGAPLVYLALILAFAIVSHSMGGLVALAYCRKYGAEKVRRLISLGAPYHGSMHAWFFPGLCLEQLRPGNRWLDDLHRAPFAWPPISSIWSWHDSMVA